MRIVRIFFSKKGEAAYISHLDLQRVMARALRKSGMPVWYSQGFNPHIYMSFALPLPLMMESEAEAVDVKTEREDESFDPYVEKLSAALPRGIDVQKIAPPVHGAEQIASALYRFSYPEVQDLPKVMKRYGSLQQALVTRKTKRTEETVDLKGVLPKLGVSPQGDTCFEARLPAGNKVHYNPVLLTGFLERAFKVPAQQAEITRLQVFTAGDEVFC